MKDPTNKYFIDRRKNFNLKVNIKIIDNLSFLNSFSKKQGYKYEKKFKKSQIAEANKKT